MSDFEKIKREIHLKDYADAHLIKKGAMYVCPACGSGTGAKGTAAFSVKDSICKCFVCNAGGDVFDLAGIIHRTDDKTEQLRIVANWAGIPVINEVKKDTNEEIRPKKQEVTPDYSRGIEAEAAKLEAWAQNIEHPEAVSYLEERGFTVDQAKEWGIGYDPARRRLVIPYRGSRYYHVDRDVTGAASFKYEKPKSEAVGKQPLENPGALKNDVVFIVEGLFDALALEACGFASIALNGTGWTNAASEIVARGYEGNVIISLDNDEAGAKAASSLLEHLHSAGIAARTSSALETIGCNDAGEAYADPAKREELKAALEVEHRITLEDAERAAEHAYNEALRNLSVKDPVYALHSLVDLRDVSDPITTGFYNLDNALNGGLRNGLTILGALSSMGKTTLMLQIADQIAESGYPVLYVTIEQSTSELIAKSVSRIMAKEKPAQGAKYNLVSAQEIRTKANREKWSDAQTNALYDAVQVYQDRIAPNILFLEGLTQPTVESIRQAAEMIKRKRGKYPVVFIDYLQLLKSPNVKLSDKQAVDQNVSDLRIMAKEKIPVFLVSSLNRESYSGLIEMTSFKESGSIEYSSDVLLGLQPANMKKRLSKKNKEGDWQITSGEERKLRGYSIIEEVKGQSVREVEMLVLKNRDGKIVNNDNALKFSYRTIPNLFEEKQG